MSKPFYLTLIALLTAGLAFFIYLAAANGKLADDAIKRCVGASEARALQARCVLLPKPEIKT